MSTSQQIKDYIDLANLLFKQAIIHKSKFFYELGLNNLKNAEILLELTNLK